MLPPAFSSPRPATATGLRSAVPVCTAATGRPSRTRTATTGRGTSTSIRGRAARTAATASAGGLFVLSKGSPNSERSERIQFFNSSILQFFNHDVEVGQEDATRGSDTLVASIRAAPTTGGAALLRGLNGRDARCPSARPQRARRPLSQRGRFPTGETPVVPVCGRNKLRPPAWGTAILAARTARGTPVRLWCGTM